MSRIFFCSSLYHPVGQKVPWKMPLTFSNFSQYFCLQCHFVVSLLSNLLIFIYLSSNMCEIIHSTCLALSLNWWYMRNKNGMCVLPYFYPLLEKLSYKETQYVHMIIEAFLPQQHFMYKYIKPEKSPKAHQLSNYFTLYYCFLCFQTFCIFPSLVTLSHNPRYHAQSWHYAWLAYTHPSGFSWHIHISRKFLILQVLWNVLFLWLQLYSIMLILYYQ